MPTRNHRRLLAWVVPTALAVGCGSPPPSTARTPSVTVALERVDGEGRGNELDYPRLGDPSALVTVLLSLEFNDAESAALFGALRRLQQRVGSEQISLVLLPNTESAATRSVDDLALRLQQLHGDAAYFAYVSEVFHQRPESSGERLYWALVVDHRYRREQRRGQAAPLVPGLRDAITEEAGALLGWAKGGVPALSVNGLRARGLIAPSRLTELVQRELEATRMLATRGVSPEQVYTRRIAVNRSRSAIVRREPANPEQGAGADEAVSPSDQAPPLGQRDVIEGRR